MPESAARRSRFQVVRAAFVFRFGSGFES